MDSRRSSGLKIVAISTEDDALERYLAARQQGYVTFIYEHADPLHQLSREKFVYVNSDGELLEKVALVKADVSVADQMMRF